MTGTGSGSAVGIMTSYRPDGLGIGIGIPVGARFSASVQTGPGAYPASYTMGTGSFREVKRSGCSDDHPLIPNAEINP